MDKTKQGYIDTLKRNTDNSFYFNLTSYLKTRIYEIQEQLVKETNMDDLKRLQGRALEMEEFLKGMTRRPVVNEHDGSYGN